MFIFTFGLYFNLFQVIKILRKCVLQIEIMLRNNNIIYTKVRNKKQPRKSYLLEIVCDFKLTLLCSNVRFDFSISIVNDGQEHVEQDEEDEEHIGNKEGRTEDTIGVLDLMEVEVTQNDTE